MQIFPTYSVFSLQRNMAIMTLAFGFLPNGGFAVGHHSTFNRNIPHSFIQILAPSQPAIQRTFPRTDGNKSRIASTPEKKKGRGVSKSASRLPVYQPLTRSQSAHKAVKSRSVQQPSPCKPAVRSQPAESQVLHVRSAVRPQFVRKSAARSRTAKPRRGQEITAYPKSAQRPQSGKAKVQRTTDHRSQRKALPSRRRRTYRRIPKKIGEPDQEGWQRPPRKLTALRRSPRDTCIGYLGDNR